MQLTGLEGRVAVVTGAASGIGQAVVRRLAREHVRLAVVDIYQGGLDGLCHELRAAAPVPFVADLTDPLEVMDLAKRILGEVGNVSFLVNVAGGPVAPSHEEPLPRLPTRAVTIEEIDDVDWARILATNLTTAFLVCRAFVPALKAQRSGRIVNFTSIAARRGSDRVGVHYAAAKGGVIGLTKTLALELGPHGITVNAIAPGFINTERIEAASWGRWTAEQHQALLAAIPLGRLGRPDDIAGVVALLCADQGGYVSGATIDVNGGLYFGP